MWRLCRRRRGRESPCYQASACAGDEAAPGRRLGLALRGTIPQSLHCFWKICVLLYGAFCASTPRVTTVSVFLSPDSVQVAVSLPSSPVIVRSTVFASTRLNVTRDLVFGSTCSLPSMFAL